MRDGLILRNVEVAGHAGLDVRLEAGRIAELGPRLAARGPELDGRGGALIPGLADHHIHLLATAARETSIVLDTLTPPEIAARVASAAAARPPGAWLRATGYSPGDGHILDRDALDSMAPAHPIRVQDRTGGLWILNGLGLALIEADDNAPPTLERDGSGRPTGRLWRGDAWLRSRLGPAAPPNLSVLGARLARLGVTAVMDASASNDASSAAILGEAVRSGALPQRLALMSGGPLAAPAGGAFAVGPVKILLDDRDLPPLDDFTARIAAARQQRRAVAVHCVTAAELTLTLAAFEAGGARPGDRIEHGGVIPAWAIAAIRDLHLTVVTQPGFIADRGDRYLTEVDPSDLPDLYRCASLLDAGVKVAGGSDAPYAGYDPWRAMQAAIDRRTTSGNLAGAGERVAPGTALGLYLGDLEDPGGPPRSVAVGAPADLCLLKAPLAEAIAEPLAERVAATLVDGKLVYLAA